MPENQSFERPILNAPYGYPMRHWEIDGAGQPTQRVLDVRSPTQFITPNPLPKMQKGATMQESLLFDETISTQDQQYQSATTNGVLATVDRWRARWSPAEWKVSTETERLLQHWRLHNFAGVCPFFRQVETAIWLTEVAPNVGKTDERFLQHVNDAHDAASPDLEWLALKLASGSGKTTTNRQTSAQRSLAPFPKSRAVIPT